MVLAADHTVIRLIPFQNPLQHANSPTHVRLAQIKHRSLHGRIRLVGMHWPAQFSSYASMTPCTETSGNDDSHSHSPVSGNAIPYKASSTIEC